MRAWWKRFIEEDNTETASGWKQIQNTCDRQSKIVVHMELYEGKEKNER